MSVESPLRKSPTEEIVATVNSLGLKKAAQHYRADPSTLYRWLRRQNYVSKRQYVKEAQTLQTT